MQDERDTFGTNTELYRKNAYRTSDYINSMRVSDYSVGGRPTIEIQQGHPQYQKIGEKSINTRDEAVSKVIAQTSIVDV